MGGQHTGSCLCKRVRFEIKGDLEHFYLCHCEHCRKDTGSAHAANLLTSRADLNWLCGEEEVRDFQLPSTRHRKSFCSTCGSALPSLQEGGALLVIPAGSLDTALEFQPTAHIFVSRRADWDHDLHTLPAFDREPD